jgi:hypothetical protein
MHEGSDESRKEREAWSRKLKVADRVPAMATAAAAKPPAPVEQSQKQIFEDDFFN